MKKTILFVMNNMNCGGAEKALISLLETIDYSLFQVDLFLFKHEGIFLSKIPAQVNLLKEPLEYKYFNMPLKTAVKQCLSNGKFDIVLSRLLAGFIFKSEKNRARCEQRVWKYISASLKKIDQKYDAVIGYLEKNPVYFSVEKVNASKKIGFIHTDYDKLGMDPAIDIPYFKRLDHIVTVSEECVNILKQKFPMYRKKIVVMYNIVSPNTIIKMSLETVDMKKKGITIVSVGRLHCHKGFEIAVKACAMLVGKGYDIRWYVIGEGEERVRLERLIEENHLQGIFILLGMKENPYPFIREADIYVQSSRFEGKSIAIDEAKILHKPIVVTNFHSVKDQIRNEENGLVVEMNAISIAKGVSRLIDDEELRNKLIRNVSREQLGTETEIEKLYEFVL